MFANQQRFRHNSLIDTADTYFDTNKCRIASDEGSTQEAPFMRIVVESELDVRGDDDRSGGGGGGDLLSVMVIVSAK